MSIVLAVSDSSTNRQKCKAAFLDRDGVINVDYGYVYKWSDFIFLPGALQAMKMLQDNGFAIIVVTNQSGIARGYYTELQFQALNDCLLRYLESQGICLAGIYYCPHHPSVANPFPDNKCSCRKPAPGLILDAQIDHNICLSQSILVGDKLTDIQAAASAGVGLRLLVDNSASLSVSDASVSWIGDSLLSCVKYAIGIEAQVLR